MHPLSELLKDMLLGHSRELWWKVDILIKQYMKERADWLKYEKGFPHARDYREAVDTAFELAEKCEHDWVFKMAQSSSDAAGKCFSLYQCSKCKEQKCEIEPSDPPKLKYCSKEGEIEKLIYGLVSPFLPLINAELFSKALTNVIFDFLARVEK